MNGGLKMSIRFENTVTPSPEQWKAAIMGARNPLNSWQKSDSEFEECDHADVYYPCVNVGQNDLDLMKRLCKAGTDHRKFMRMLSVIVTITAPLYWWKEFDTYKVGTVANSCSTMHKIHAKEFTMEDFSCEHLIHAARIDLGHTIDALNFFRGIYLHGGMVKDEDGNLCGYGKGAKQIWWQMIQLLPSSYNQKRTVMMNYEVLANIYKSRKNHKLDEWAEHKESKENKELTKNFASGKFGFCDWIKTLPYSELITGEIPQC